MLTNITSNPLLMAATILLVLGPLVFLTALIQFIRAGRQPHTPVNMDEPTVETSAPEPEKTVTPTASVLPHVKEEVEEIFPVPPEAKEEPASDKTIVMPSGMGEIQGQMEIAFSQIKNLNKKIFQMESEMESLSRQASSKLETNELKEPPMNAADFTQKLLKLAEHVIVLEKEVSRLKSQGKQSSEGNGAEEESQPANAGSANIPSTPRPPILPI